MVYNITKWPKYDLKKNYGFVAPGSEKDRVRYEKSKERERKYNERWKQHKVNLNELVNKYAPGATPKIKGVKAIFEYPNTKAK